MFADFAEKPVASGSIAQIHKAHLSAGGAHSSDYPAGTPVAVKVGSPHACHVAQPSTPASPQRQPPTPQAQRVL